MTTHGELVIDGSEGEGGGQILRTSLALAVVTGRPIRIDNIRAKRQKPGLMRQHLTAVLAAARVGNAEVDGATLGSSTVRFRPTGLCAGDHHFEIGTAGSATLVLQTVLPPLLQADGSSRIVIEGGTHNPMAPPFPFLERSFLPCLRRMGVTISATCERLGFYPAGGGRIVVTVEPCAQLAPLELLDAGRWRGGRAQAIVADLPRHIGEREIAIVRQHFNWPEIDLSVVAVRGSGPGNAVVLTLMQERMTEVVCVVGEKRVPAEAVATAACEEALRYLDAGAPVGEHLADQLLLPMALAGEGRFRTGPLSRHAETNVSVIERFLPVHFAVDAVSARVVEVSVAPEPAACSARLSPALRA